MCIYYTNRDDLTYTSSEHIFPAGLGGRCKLPKGYVSTEFNNEISKLELEFIRDSVISIPRQIHGPGKRGKSSPRHATKSKILVIETGFELRPFLLGYSQSQSIIEIPQFYYDSFTLKGNIGFGTHDKSEAEKVLANFMEICKNPGGLRIRTILDGRLPETFFMFGIENIGRKEVRGVFAKNPSNSFDLSVSRIQQIAQLPLKVNNLKVFENIKTKVTQILKFEESYLRIYGKTAFNFLAYLEKDELVKSSIFDPFRNWVSNGNGNNFAYWDFKSLDPFKALNITLPEHSHYVLIQKESNKLVARVCIYMLPVVLILCDNYFHSMPARGLICDWKNHVEYSVEDYLRITNQLPR